MCVLEKGGGKRLEYSLSPSQGPGIGGGGETQRKMWEGDGGREGKHKRMVCNQVNIWSIIKWICGPQSIKWILVRVSVTWKDGKYEWTASFISSPQREFSALATSFPVSHVNKRTAGFSLIWELMRIIGLNWKTETGWFLYSSCSFQVDCTKSFQGIRPRFKLLKSYFKCMSFGFDLQHWKKYQISFEY